MKRLPHWCITDKFPALYDTESATSIEMTAKVYGAMNELVDEYNKFVDNVNVEIEKFETSTEKDIELFKVAMRQEFQDFIDVVELKLQSQDNEIADAIKYMKNNLYMTIKTTVNEMIESGEFNSVVISALNEVSKRLDNLYDNRLFTKSILDYGAKNDGSVDIKNAIERAYADGVTQLFFPEGTYLCNEYINNIPMNYIAGNNVIFNGTKWQLFNLEGGIKFADLADKFKYSSWAMKKITTEFDGTAGMTGSALQVRTETHNEGSFEWNLLCVNDNYANSGENVAGYFQGNKYGLGETWGACVEAIERNRVANPTTGLVGIEVDVSADETDEGCNRVGIDVYMRKFLETSETQRQYGYGLRINSQDGITIHGIALNGMFACGLDFSGANISGNAMLFAGGQKLTWDSLNLYGVTNVLCIDIAGERIAECRNTGLTVNHGITSASFKANSVTFKGDLKGSGVSNMANNALAVDIAGTTYYIPIYTS